MDKEVTLEEVDKALAVLKPVHEAEARYVGVTMLATPINYVVHLLLRLRRVLAGDTDGTCNCAHTSCLICWPLDENPTELEGGDY